MAKITAITNEKGGVDKTATATMPACLLSKRGRHTALLDFGGVHLSYENVALIVIETLEIERPMNPHDTETSGTFAKIIRSSGSRAKPEREYNLTEDKLAKYIRIGEYADDSLTNLFDKRHFTISAANTLSFRHDESR